MSEDGADVNWTSSSGRFGNDGENFPVAVAIFDGRSTLIINSPDFSVSVFVSCRIPDDCIDPKRYPLFMAREVVLELLAQFKAESKVDAKVGT